MITELKILNGLSSDVVRLRALRNKYETNRAIKGYSLFIVLKSMTESGIIHNYPKQIEDIGEILGICRASVYNYLQYAVELKLVDKDDTELKRLKLVSWQKVVDEFCLPDKTFTTIYYDNEKTHKIEHILRTIEFTENRQRQKKAIVCKLSKNPTVKAAFQAYTKGMEEFNLTNLNRVQREIFEKGSAARIYKPLLQIVNPEFYRSNKTIAKAHNYKSTKSIAYLKRSLRRYGLITVTKNTNPTCSYNKNRIQGVERGKQPYAFCFYAPNTRQKTWFKPDTVEACPGIFNPPQAAPAPLPI